MSTEGAVISFSRGAPSLDILDVEGLQASASRVITADPAGTLAYGAASGYGPLREWIAGRYGVADNQVLVTNGSMQADAFLFQLQVQAGDVVLTERPSYDRTLLSLRERGAELVMVDVQSDGIDVDQVEKLLESGVRPKLAHIIPHYQNPAGVTLSLEKRKRLVELAEQYGFLIFEDDPYVELGFDRSPLPTMFSLDRSGRVAYVSSFTKTVCPGVRVGYVVASVELTAQLQRLATNTYIAPCQVSQAIVNDFCRSGGFERSIQTVKTALNERCNVLAQSLRDYIPQAQFTKPDGGYFMWVQLPEGTDIDRLHTAAADVGVQFVKGSDFIPDGGQNAVRLAFSAVGPELIEDGIQRLAKLL